MGVPVLVVYWGQLADMLASVLIIAISTLLLVYWFRYTCLLLLRARAAQTEAPASLPDARWGLDGIREKMRDDENACQHIG